MAANSSNGNQRNNNNGKNNVVYQEQSQLIIRPNVSNLNLVNDKKFKNKRNKQQDHKKSVNGFQNKKNNFNNRGRGFHANNNHHYKTQQNQNHNKSYQTQQNNSFNHGGYKSYRTANHHSFRQNLIKSPYQRPNNQRRPKVRQLPSYQQQQSNYLQNKRQTYQNMK